MRIHTQVQLVVLSCFRWKKLSRANLLYSYFTVISAVHKVNKNLKLLMTLRRSLDRTFFGNLPRSLPAAAHTSHPCLTPSSASPDAVILNVARHTNNTKQLQSSQDGMLQQRPKGVPPHIRQSFDYFVYPGSSTGSETSLASSDEDGVSLSPPAPHSTPPGRTDIEAPADDSDGSPGGEAPATPPPATGEGGGESRGIVEQGGRAAPPNKKTKDREHVRGAEENHRPMAESFSPTTMHSIPTGCAACADSFCGGDELCRIPCGHVFHAEVRQTSGMPSAVSLSLSAL